MAVFLVAVWWWRRSLYPSLRLTVVLATLACLLVQVVPVAPPRLLPGLGFVDTALVRGESVYGPYGTGLANQLSAMPSVHVAWATIVAVFLWRAGGPLLRGLGVVHLALTVTAVVVTANHWWLDGVVAAVLVAAALSASEAWYRRAQPEDGRMAPWPTALASRTPSPSGSSCPHGRRAVSELTDVIEAGGGVVTALDVTASGRDRVRVDVTCAARDTEHAETIVDAAARRRGRRRSSKVSDRTFLMHLGGKIEIESQGADPQPRRPLAGLHARRRAGLPGDRRATPRTPAG